MKNKYEIRADYKSYSEWNVDNEGKATNAVSVHLLA